MHDQMIHDRGSTSTRPDRASLLTRWFGGLNRRKVWGMGALTGTMMAGTLLLSAPAAAAEPGEGMRARVGARMCAEIECTDAQREGMKKIFEDLRTAAKTHKDALREIHVQLANEWAKDKPSKATMQKLRNDANKHHAQMEELRHEAFMKVHALLEPAQRKELAQMIADGKMRHMMGPGHGRHGKGKRGDKAKSKTPKAKSK